MKHIREIKLLLPLFILISSCSAQTNTNKKDTIDKLVSAYAEYGQFSGTILVAESGKILYKKGFGLADTKAKIPNKTDTKFRLASVTKQFTAMLIMQLVSENKLKLDAPISTYLPDYPKKTAEVVTIHHLLTHTSGIPNYTSFPIFYEMMKKEYRPEDMINIFCDSTLEFTPGEKHAYSNSGYVLLGHIVEKITGKSYGQVLEEKIFKPLKMTNSCYNPNDEEIKNKALGYNKAGTNLRPANYIHMSVPFAAGAIYSTVEDMYLWDQALYTEKLLPKKYRDLLFEKHISNGRGDYYGYGWEIGNMPIGRTDNDIETISHSGSINGFSTLITRIPSDKLVVVLLNNTGGAPLEEITWAITAILHDKPYDFPKKSVANSLLEVIEKDGIEKAVSYYNKVKDSRDYYLTEVEMNNVGYELLWADKTREAASVFKLNTEAYPNSANAYDSYAESLLKLKDTTGAIENYKKSLALNPGIQSGLKTLAELGVNTDGLIKKVSIEELKALEGEYVITNPPAGRDKEWKIIIQVQNGELTGSDRGYRYRLLPVGDNAFVNPDDGASVVFDTSNKDAVTVTLFKKFEFKRVK